MTHEIWHIICGTAGDEQGERQITIYQGSALDFAVALKPDGLAAAGLNERQIARLKRRLDRFYEDFTDDLESMGVPYQSHEPHPENFPDHD